ncbi:MULTISPECIES: chemotaxis protein CheV [Salinivibrio]|uniref:Chemotaxis protein CheV n=2 Tax=Salinivibrio TaxID=51366 RepID=A0ABY7LHC5_9GAMM|nr:MULTISPECIES: chemotaxis protein CheV [Salinivibrio]ODQ01447.1 chemotaxis protein CheW [Salinivibrio sp. DV]OOF20622.1 chemotaxis protein CheW [Salinivibrio sp. IB574]PCE65351.1 chemotaxis protein CheV [Salinivibrio sp. YCSC6]QCF37615.1 chemotaxis protein CheV [Salinivibrio sp. YCSC6]QIR07781.1 chemotaxis protein CheV [Salinivibrio costicola]
MTNILDSVDSRTRLVGENRLELLMFYLGTTQPFAINVFKVREVIKVPRLNQMPGSHPNVRGVAMIRGKSIPVIDLRQSIGMGSIGVSDDCNVIVTEYNRTIQAFLVGQVINIKNMGWDEIMEPPKGTGRNNYLTAITRQDFDGQTRLVEIVDVEKILAEIVAYEIGISEDVLDPQLTPYMAGQRVLVVDDSSTARAQVSDTLSQFGVECIMKKNGAEALQLLKSWCDEGKNVSDEILLMITDAEMPEMDGYKLTHEVRSDSRMSDLYIALNTSLSGSFNEAMVEKVGCNQFISKFQPDLLVNVVQERLREVVAS